MPALFMSTKSPRPMSVRQVHGWHHKETKRPCVVVLLGEGVQKSGVAECAAKCQQPRPVARCWRHDIVIGSCVASRMLSIRLLQTSFGVLVDGDVHNCLRGQHLLVCH